MIIYVLCLSCFLVCSLQPCVHLLDKGYNLLVLFYVMFSCVFATFSCGALGQVWYLIVSIPDLCLLTYYKYILLYDIVAPDSVVVVKTQRLFSSHGGFLTIAM